MKVILVCALIAFAVATPQHDILSEITKKWVKLSEPHQKHCIEESGVEVDTVENAIKQYQFPDERPFKCYLNCLHLNLNVMNSNGDLIADTIKDDFKNVKELQELIKEEKDLCEKSYLFVTHAVKQFASNTT